jgi:hypothetical protein
MCELVARLDLVELRLASPCSAGLHAGEWSNGPAMRLAAPMATQYKRGGGVVPGGGRARARVGLKCSPFIGCRAEPLVRCTHAEGGAGRAGHAAVVAVTVGPDGPAWARENLSRTSRARRRGLGPRSLYLLFQNILPCKHNSGNSRNCFQSTKNTPKIPKNAGKFLDAHWDLKNPNKVFGAHGKDFRAF